METSIFSSQYDFPKIEKPVFITGLARSGTTILLELLARNPHFTSHQYRDFPLLQTPIWWNWFYNQSTRNNQDPVERYHQDRIMITPDSPEAMEEILWMASFPECHNQLYSNILDDQTQNPDFELFYKDHIRKLLYIRAGQRYLCKGNYNFLRLGYLNKLFPDAKFIIPVRQPENHIASLQKQHVLLCQKEQEDPGALAYMQLAGHYEFGLDRRPANVNNLELTKEIESYWSNGQDIRGWAVYWSSLYQYLADLLSTNPVIREQTIVVHYEQLCRNPEEILSKIYTHCNIEISEQTLIGQASELSLPDYYNSKFSPSDVSEIERSTTPALENILKFA